MSLSSPPLYGDIYPRSGDSKTAVAPREILRLSLSFIETRMLDKDKRGDGTLSFHPFSTCTFKWELREMDDIFSAPFLYGGVDSVCINEYPAHQVLLSKFLTFRPTQTHTNIGFA